MKKFLWFCLFLAVSAAAVAGQEGDQLTVLRVGALLDGKSELDVFGPEEPVHPPSEPPAAEPEPKRKPAEGPRPLPRPGFASEMRADEPEPPKSL